MSLQGPFRRRALGLSDHGGKPAANSNRKDAPSAGRFLSHLPVADVKHHPLLYFILPEAVVTNRSIMSY